MRKINPLKNAWLKLERGASIEEVMLSGVLVANRRHPARDDQILEFYYYNFYVWVVVIGKNPDRVITMYKSRKAQREFGHGKKE